MARWDNRFTPEQDEVIRRHYGRGNMLTLCRDLHSTLETVDRRAHELGLPMRPIRERKQRGDKGVAARVKSVSTPHRPVQVCVPPSILAGRS